MLVVLQPWLSTTGIRAVQRLMLAGRLTARMGVMWAPDPSVAIEEWGRTIAGSGVSSWFGNEWSIPAARTIMGWPRCRVSISSVWW